MKVNDVPQDYGIESGTKRLNVAVDDQGNYIMVQSVGWSPVNSAFSVFWEFTQKNLEEIRQKAVRGEASPLHYHMLAKLMNEKFLAAYAGFFVWQTKRHLKPGVFRTLKPGVVGRYARALNMTVEQLKTVPSVAAQPIPAESALDHERH
jgi:hypothetical protein